MSSIDTRVDGTPSAILGVAAWLEDSLASGAATLDEAVYAQYRRVPEVWEGDAAEGLRGRLSTLSGGGETLRAAAESTAREVQALAAILEAVQADMAGARSQASAAGLAVAGTVINGPGAAPPSVPALPPGATSAEAQAHGQALAAVRAHEARCAVWDTVVEIVEAAHLRWETAVENAGATWENNAGNLASLVSGLLTAGVTGAAMATVAYNASLMRGFHLEQAASYASHLRAVTNGGRVTTSAAHYYELLDTGAQHADDAARLLDDVRAPGTPTRLARGLTALGVAVTGYAIYDDIQHGESPAQAAVSNGAGLGASMLAGAGVGALAGSFIPVGGTIVGGVLGAVVGAGVGIVTSGAIDSMWEKGVENGGDVLEAIGDGWDELTTTVTDTGALIGDAADAVGGAAKDAWNAIF